MSKINHLFFILLLTSCKIYAQEIPVFECHYKIKAIKGNDTSEIIKVVWITQNNIYEFNENNPLKYSFYDFEKKIRRINITGNVHELDLKSLRMEYQKRIENTKFREFNSNVMLSIPKNQEVVYLDSSIKIPCITAGYRDFLDNGTGFLPIYSNRKTYDVNGDEVTFLISLESKGNTIIDQKRIHGK